MHCSVVLLIAGDSMAPLLCAGGPKLKYFISEMSETLDLTNQKIALLQ